MIDEAQALETLTGIFRSELDMPNLALNISTKQADIRDWDSLAHVRIVMATERAFGIQFEVEEIESIDSVRSLYEAVARHAK